MSWTDDPLADFARHDDEEQEFVKKLPVCADCGEPVMDDYYFLINDEVICPKCMDRNYRKWTDEYIA